MKEYICKRCGRTFSQKGHLENHLKKKNPCKQIENKIIEEKIQEKLKELVKNGDIEIKNTNLILLKNVEISIKETNMFSISEKYINCRCGLHLKEYQQEDPYNPGRMGIINGKGKFTCCHKHEHITREKYEEVVPKIIDEFLEAGFYETDKYFRDKKGIDVNKEYNHLKKDTIDIDKITAQKTSKSNTIIREYMPHIYEVEDYKGNNILKLWTKEKLTKAFKSLDKPNYTVNSNLSELKRVLKFNPVTIYSPIMTKSLVSSLDCKTIFDPCIGWGGRMIGTTCLGEEYHYTGCEPFTKTYEGLERMSKDLNILSQIDIYNKPVEDVLDTLKDKRYDMCLTSPPYYDLEVYSHEETQSIKKYETYEDWINEFIKPIIEYVCSNVDKFSCWSVKNIKTDKKYNLLDDVIKIHLENGWCLYKEYSIKKNTQKSSSADGDITYVFKKSHPPLKK